MAPPAPSPASECGPPPEPTGGGGGPHELAGGGGGGPLRTAGAKTWPAAVFVYTCIFVVYSDTMYSEGLQCSKGSKHEVYMDR